MNVICLDFVKIFDLATHNSPINKLSNSLISRQTIIWREIYLNYQAQRVSGSKSHRWKSDLETSGVSPRSDAVQCSCKLYQ